MTPERNSTLVKPLLDYANRVVAINNNNQITKRMEWRDFLDAAKDRENLLHIFRGTNQLMNLSKSRHIYQAFPYRNNAFSSCFMIAGYSEFCICDAERPESQAILASSKAVVVTLHNICERLIANDGDFESIPADWSYDLLVQIQAFLRDVDEFKRIDLPLLTVKMFRSILHLERIDLSVLDVEDRAQHASLKGRLLAGLNKHGGQRAVDACNAILANFNRGDDEVEVEAFKAALDLA